MVYLGGLTDGLLACPYVEALGEICHARGWALVQPVLSSSYAGYGTGSLDRDTEEVILTSTSRDWLYRSLDTYAFFIRYISIWLLLLL